MAVVDESGRTYSHPLYDFMLDVPGLSVAVGPVDRLLTWGLKNALWIFPMATSCCGIEFMAAAASRIDMDRMGVIIRGTPRQADVMVVAGTITVKMAPRVKKLWDMMPEPKWCVAMGSCAISGDFYRDLYPSIPGIDTVVPVDVYVPGCPPNPEELMAGMIRLQEKVKLVREGNWPKAEARPELEKMIRPAIRRLSDADRDPKVSEAQVARSVQLVESAPMVERPTAPREVVADSAESTPAAAAADADTNAVLTTFGATEFPKDAPPLIPSDRHRALAEALQQRGYRQLTFVVASHWPEKRDKTGETVTDPEHFELAYGVRSSGRGTSLVQWRVRVNVTDAIDSLWGIYAGADWHEREQYDLFGVNFAGHPDLRRILLPHDYEFFPLRKDRAADAPCFPWR